MKAVINSQPNKIYITNRSSLEGRIDPNPYHFERINSLKKLQENNELLKLSDVVKSVKTTTKNISENQVYIGLENILSNSGEYIPSVEKQSISSAGIFKKGQILFPKLRPYLNKVYLAEFDGICSTEFHIFDCPIYRNEFLAIYLRSDLIVNQTKYLMTGNTLPRLQTEDINRLPVPKISLEKQDEIIALYQNAYKQKQQKETEANLLLVSIDAYLLNELGITIPKKDNSLQDRIYTISFSELTGGRFDVFDALNKDSKIEGGIFLNKKLKEVGVFKKGQSITSERIFDGIYPVIAGGQSSPYSHNQFNFEGDVITVSASGAYSGYVWYHNAPIFASDCTVIKTKDPKVISTCFLFELMKLKQKEIYNLQQGAGQPHVYASDLAKLNIPIPPRHIQEKMILYIQDLRIRAKQLQFDAKSLIENAKAEIEQKILGYN